MAEVAKLVGIEVREYTGQDGKQRRYQGLHLVHVEHTVRDVEGCKVEVVSCPRGVELRTLDLGKAYQMEYEMYDTKNGKMARLVDLLPVEA